MLQFLNVFRIHGLNKGEGEGSIFTKCRHNHQMIGALGTYLVVGTICHRIGKTELKLKTVF